MRALRDFNIAKIVKVDEVVFFGLLNDLFPGRDPPRVVDDFVTCAALEDSVPLEDFAADDVLQVGFPKLQDAPSLQPPAE